MKRKVCFLLLLMFALLGAESCRTESQAQKATNMARKRYKYIKHDCRCHTYVYPQENKSQNAPS